MASRATPSNQRTPNAAGRRRLFVPGRRPPSSQTSGAGRPGPRDAGGPRMDQGATGSPRGEPRSGHGDPRASAEIHRLHASAMATGHCVAAIGQCLWAWRLACDGDHNCTGGQVNDCNTPHLRCASCIVRTALPEMQRLCKHHLPMLHRHHRGPSLTRASSSLISSDGSGRWCVPCSGPPSAVTRAL